MGDYIEMTTFNLGRDKAPRRTKGPAGRLKWMCWNLGAKFITASYTKLALYFLVPAAFAIGITLGVLAWIHRAPAPTVDFLFLGDLTGFDTHYIGQNITANTTMIVCDNSRFAASANGECPFGNGMVLTANPTRVQYTVTPSCGLTQTFDCSLAGSASAPAACTVTQVVTASGKSGTILRNTITDTTWYTGNGTEKVPNHTGAGPTRSFHLYAVTSTSTGVFTGLPTPPPCLPNSEVPVLPTSTASSFVG